MSFLIISLVLHVMSSNAVLIDPTSSDEHILVQLTNDPRGLNEINSNNEWELNEEKTNPLNDWALELDLDAEKYSFKSEVDGSSISITIDLDRDTTEADAHFAFSIGDNSYFTFMVDLDGYYNINLGRSGESKNTGIFIYPPCGSTSIPSGDVSTLISSIPSSDYDVTTLREELCGGDQDNCHKLTSSQNGANYPITFEIINNDLSDTFTFKFSSPTFEGDNALTCEYDTSLDTGEDFKLYMSPDIETETITIESFEIEGTLTGYTLEPTNNPTTSDPTPAPTLDGCDFDIDAYLEQCYCTNDGYITQLEEGSPFYKHNNYQGYDDRINKYNYNNNQYYNRHDINNNFLLYLILFLNAIILIILGFFICVYFGFCGKNNGKNKYEKVYLYSDPEDDVKNAINQ